MSGKNIIFNDEKINKSKFYKNKKLSKTDDIDMDKILVLKIEPYGTKNSLKYFFGYNDDGVSRPLCIAYVKQFDSNKTMSFKVIDNKLLKRFQNFWERVSSLMNIEFDSQHVNGDNDKHINTKIKSYGDKINTNFQGKKLPKEDASYKCLSLIMLDSVVRVSKKYYPQIVLEECKYTIQENKMENLINDGLDPSSSDESNNESTNGFNNESEN